MTRGGHGRTRRMATPAPLRYLSSVTGLAVAAAAFMAAAELPTAAGLPVDH
ncbi:hypothetical protein ACTWLT_19420 [Micromonospora sp. ZYX-F-536]|uniref:hypothetical protein n=1 Tax=Micromonospora sp. ZYX-F-536 TaxID=3457629 RepID=UPI0040409694